MNQYVLGIDLGTYNSAAAVMTPNGDIVPISAGTADRSAKAGERVKPFPSVVVYNPDGTIRAVGREAKELAESEPQWAVWGVKRLLGKTYKEALEHGELDRMLIPVDPDESNGRCTFLFDNKDVQPEDVCSALLRHIRRVAEEQIGEELPNTIISVPAYFDAIAISATIDSAKRAGIASVNTIPEPVAAALSGNMQVTPRPINFLVFDIGAGTLDVSASAVWRSGQGPTGLECHCMKNTGNTHLGGLDMDDRLVQLLPGRMELHLISDEERLQLRRAAEAAKIDLSFSTETHIQLSQNGVNKTCKLTRFELEEMLRSDPRDLIDACEEQVRLALEGADWRPEEVERLLLVGGPTAMPCIRDMLARVFHRNPLVLDQIKRSEEGRQEDAVDPMLAVCTGAARSRGARVTKVHPYGYGFVNVRVEPLRGEPMCRVHREPCILIERDSVFPSEPVVVTPDNPYYRRDKIFSVEIIEHAPETEQNIPGIGRREHRFLGEFQLAFRRIPYLMQLSMRLNEDGELETSIRNLKGSEVANYVGVGSLVRQPIDLPASKLEAMGQYTSGKSVFLPAQADKVKNWGTSAHRFVNLKHEQSPSQDRHVADMLDDMRTTLNRWDAHPEESVNSVFTLGKSVLLRAQEVKVITEAERHRFEDELDSARESCFRWEEQ